MKFMKITVISIVCQLHVFNFVMTYLSVFHESLGTRIIAVAGDIYGGV